MQKTKEHKEFYSLSAKTTASILAFFIFLGPSLYYKTIDLLRDCEVMVKGSYCLGKKRDMLTMRISSQINTKKNKHTIKKLSKERMNVFISYHHPYNPDFDYKMQKIDEYQKIMTTYFKPYFLVIMFFVALFYFSMRGLWRSCE